MYCCFRPNFSRASKSTLPANAPASQAKERTSLGAPGTDVVSGVKANEASLAGYLLARTALNKNVDGQTLQNLRAGHETVQQGNELLPLGRANVIQDVEKAKGEHLPQRKDATDKLVEDLLFNHLRHGRDLTDADVNGAITAASLHAKTGTCGSFASVNTTLHAAKLADMKDERAVVAHAAHKTIDHGWAEMMPNGRNADRTPILHEDDVVMDGWCKEKLAILRGDGAFARLDKDGKGDHLKHDDPLNHITGPEALRTVEKYKAQIDKSPYFQDTFNSELKRLVDEKHEWPKESFWSATSVFHPEFRRQATAALHKDVKQVTDTKDVQEAAKHAPAAKKSLVKKVFRNRAEEAKQKDVRNQAEQVKHASMAEIQAFGVALSLGSNIRGAKAEAPGIIASAKELFPGPRSQGN